MTGQQPGPRRECFICGDPSDHNGVRHSEVTGDGRTRADVPQDRTFVVSSEKPRIVRPFRLEARARIGLRQWTTVATYTRADRARNAFTGTWAAVGYDLRVIDRRTGEVVYTTEESRG